jgi:hypothetical protein
MLHRGDVRLRAVRARAPDLRQRVLLPLRLTGWIAPMVRLILFNL